jgi:hypothetical protein
MLAIGWPLSLAVGSAISFSTGSAIGLAIGVVVAGLLAALTLLPVRPSIQWRQVLSMTAGWSLGWIIGGMGSWDFLFYKFSAYDYSLDYMLNYENALFIDLVVGAVLSALVGGGVITWLSSRSRQR